MILVRIDRNGADAVWLPRDLVVDDGSGGSRRLNGYLDDGPEALIDAVRRVTGAPIDHYVQVDFAGFIRIVDTVGGTRLWVPRPVRDLYSGLDLAGTGCTTFDGDAALAWVRSRHLEERDGDTWVDISPHADLDRIARQQEMLLAIATRVRARLGDPATADRVAERVLASLTVDAGMSRDDVKLLADRLLDPGRLRTATAPNLAGPGPGRPAAARRTALRERLRVLGGRHHHRHHRRHHRRRRPGGVGPRVDRHGSRCAAEPGPGLLTRAGGDAPGGAATDLTSASGIRSRASPLPTPEDARNG